MLLARVATGSESPPEVQAVPPLEESPSFIVCNYSGSGAKSAGFFSNKQRTGVSCVATQFWPSPFPRSSTSRMDQQSS